MIIYTLAGHGEKIEAHTHKVKITTPEIDITISEDTEGRLMLNATHGRLVIEPQASNSIKFTIKNPRGG